MGWKETDLEEKTEDRTKRSAPQGETGGFRTVCVPYVTPSSRLRDQRPEISLGGPQGKVGIHTKKERFTGFHVFCSQGSDKGLRHR